MSEHSLSLRLKVLHTLKLACYCDSLARVSRRDNPLHFPKLINVLIRVTSEQVKHRVLHNHVLQHLHSSHPHTLTSSTFQYPHRTTQRAIHIVCEIAVHNNTSLHTIISVMLRPVWVSATQSDNHGSLSRHHVTHSHRHCKASVPLKSFQVILTVRQDVFSPFVHTTSSLSVMGCIEPWEFDTSHLRPPVPRKTTHLRAIYYVGDTA